jgi:hypothetical protein
MGSLSEMHRKNRFRKPAPNRAPLRKIVGYDGHREVLECGHTQNPREDFIGETNAVRRRCQKCAAGSPPNATLSRAPGAEHGTKKEE